jgi:hypothetical protein
MRIAVLGLAGLITAISAAGPAAKFLEPQGHMMLFNGAPNVVVRRYSPWSWTHCPLRRCISDGQRPERGTHRRADIRGVDSHW